MSDKTARDHTEKRGGHTHALLHHALSAIAHDVLVDPNKYILRDFEPNIRKNAETIEVARRKAVVALHACRNRNLILLDRLYETERALSELQAQEADLTWTTIPSYTQTTDDDTPTKLK